MSILLPASQRRTLRRAVRVDCQVVRERDFKLLGDWALDLSTDGMLVITRDIVLTGEEVIVSFPIPRTRVIIDAVATVARVVHGRRPTDRDRRALGIAFDSIEPEHQRLLRASLRHIPPPLPSRRPRIDYAASVHMAALE
jgi:c-di-GMP-binding flagellar brake protein YcgR